MKMHQMLVLAAGVAALPFVLFAAKTTTLTVESGQTFDLAEGAHDATYNTTANAIELLAGSTLKLKDASLKAYLRVKGGEAGAATIVAPEGVTTLNLTDGLYEYEEGSLVVQGADKITVGLNTTAYASWASILATNIAFRTTDGEAANGSVVLTNRLYVALAPKSTEACAVSVAPGTLLAFRSQEGLKSICGEETDLQNFTLAKDWGLMMMSDETFPVNTTVTVGGGATFLLKPCTVNLDDNNWAGFWASKTPATSAVMVTDPFSHVTNIVLRSDANGRAKVLDVSMREFDFMGDISGDGDFEMLGNVMNQERTNFGGDLTFTGTFTISGRNDGVVAHGASLGDPANAVWLNGTSNRLQIRGDGSTKTNWVCTGELHTKASDILYLYCAKTWEIGTFYGGATIDSNDFGYTNQINLLKADACPLITGKLTLRLLNAEAGAMIGTSTRNGSMPVLDLRDFAGETVPPVNVVAGMILTVLGGEGKELHFTGEGQVRDEAGRSIPINAKTVVDIPAGTEQTLDLSAVDFSTNWAVKATLWFDASKASTLGGYPDGKAVPDQPVTYTNGYPVINRWYDCRAGYGNGEKFLFNGRSLDAAGTAYKDRHDEVNPYVVKGGLNGLDYVSCGSYQKQIDKKWMNPNATPGTQAEARRLCLVNGIDGKDVITSPTTNITCKYAILVFGSANGGGAAVLGGLTGRDQTSFAKPFFKDGSWPMYVNGVSTNGTTATPNGGWQILSIPLSDKAVNAIGWRDGYGNSGGQDYAEILLFEQALTDGERRACEVYLAKKWGLTSSYRGTMSVSPAIVVNGGGSLTVASDAEISGGFHGEVTVEEGQTLAIANYPAPPGEEVVPSANRLAWFDPDAENALYCYGGERPLNVDALYARTETGVPEQKGLAFSGLRSTDRRPWMDESARGEGPVRKWLNFRNKYQDGAGNTMRSQSSYANSTDYNAITNTREVLMVLDTVLGGGTPIGADVSMSSMKRGGDSGGQKISDPIWPSNKVVVDATTRLDEVEVNGYNVGFNGRPEVLEFTTPEAWKPAFIGSYQQAGGQGNNNSEIIGEMLFYSEPLSDAVRKEVTMYLAHKWFGKVWDGYSDLTRMTVKGAGRVEVASLAALAPLTDDFTGTLALHEQNYSFTIDPTVNPSAATDAWDKACALELPIGAKVTVNIAKPLAGDTYTLISKCVLADGQLPELVVTGDPEALKPVTRSNGKTRLRLFLEGGALKLFASPAGMVLIFR